MGINDLKIIIFNLVQYLIFGIKLKVIQKILQ
jgi:hypothetical protein